MSRINSSHARVRVVVGIHAETKRSGGPEGRSPPVIVVVTKAVHLLRQTFFLHLSLFPLLSLALPHPLLFRPSLRLSSQFFITGLVGFFGLAVTVLVVVLIDVNLYYRLRENSGSYRYLLQNERGYFVLLMLQLVAL